MTPLTRARNAIIATLLVPTLLLAGCGTDGDAKPKAEPSADLPTGNVDVPDGVEPTEAGTELKFGEPATVAYEPNTQRSSVLSLSVDSIQEGRIADFAAYQLDDRTRKSRPYFVRVTVKNLGKGDLSRAAIPLLAVNDKDTQFQPSSFNNTFARCPSLPLPAGFVGGKSVLGCLVYLIPDGGKLVEMNYRPLQAFEPITWQDTILPPVIEKKKKDKKKDKKKANP